MVEKSIKGKKECHYFKKLKEKVITIPTVYVFESDNVRICGFIKDIREGYKDYQHSSNGKAFYDVEFYCECMQDKRNNCFSKDRCSIILKRKNKG